MRRVPAGKFRARCSGILEKVRLQGAGPDHQTGKPVAKLVPIQVPVDDFIGRLKGVIEVLGDIESPVEPPKAWKAAL